MATITSANNNSFKNSPRRSYISVAAFNADFFTYTTSMNANYVTTGTLSAVSGATAANCPKGRVLRENGRKLYPSANPGITTYMVGVFDDKTFLNGFIDPNSPVFALYNTDKPVYMDNGIDPGPGGLTDKGAPVYTNSSVEAGTTITAGGSIAASTVTASTAVSGTATINPALGNVFTFTATLSGGLTLAASSTPPGQIIYVLFTNGGGQTLTAGTNVGLNGNTSLTNGKRCNICLVSNGTLFVEVSRLIFT